MIREKMPGPIQRHIWNSNCQADSVDEDDGGFSFYLTHCAKPDLDSEILEAVQRFRADSELQNKLRGRMSQLTIVIASFARNAQTIEDIVESLQGSS